jgi:hypothetical protein
MGGIRKGSSIPRESSSAFAFAGVVAGGQHCQPCPKNGIGQLLGLILGLAILSQLLQSGTGGGCPCQRNPLFGAQAGLGGGVAFAGAGFPAAFGAGIGGFLGI